MTLSNGQALAGAHIPRLIPLQETVKLSPNATTLRAVRRASIGGTWSIVHPMTGLPAPSHTTVKHELRGQDAWVFWVQTPRAEEPPAAPEDRPAASTLRADSVRRHWRDRAVRLSADRLFGRLHLGVSARPA
jgi:hypothetical protein